MPNFVGHSVPGAAYLFVGLWFLIQIIRRLHRCYNTNNNHSDTTFRSTLYFPITICGKTIKLDSWLVMIFCAIGMAIEIHSAVVGTNETKMNAAMQHIVMYFCFFTSGLASLIVPRLPPLLDSETVTYIAYALSTIVEGILFIFHTKGQEAQEKTVHLLLIFTIFAQLVAILFEMRHRSNIYVSVSRAFFIMLQGTWFIQVSFLLFPPMTDFWGRLPQPKLEGEELHSTVMFLACLYCWHVAGLFILVLLCCWLPFCCRRTKPSPHLPTTSNDHFEENNNCEDVQLLLEIRDT